MARPHPYIDENGEGWPDNDHRFMAFSAAIATLAKNTRPDILHLNDWHCAATLGMLADLPPTVLTIHTLGTKGTRLGPGSNIYRLAPTTSAGTRDVIHWPAPSLWLTVSLPSAPTTPAK